MDKTRQLSGPIAAWHAEHVCFKHGSQAVEVLSHCDVPTLVLR